MLIYRLSIIFFDIIAHPYTRRERRQGAVSAGRDLSGDVSIGIDLSGGELGGGVPTSGDEKSFILVGRGSLERSA